MERSASSRSLVQGDAARMRQFSGHQSPSLRVFQAFSTLALLFWIVEVALARFPSWTMQYLNNLEASILAG